MEGIEEGINALGRGVFRGLYYCKELQNDGLTVGKWVVEFILYNDLVKTEPCPTPDIAFRVAVKFKQEEAI